MADRVRFIQPVSRELEKRGCKKIAELDDYNSLWITNAGVAITVPDCGKDDKCPEARWFEVLSDVAKYSK